MALFILFNSAHIVKDTINVLKGLLNEVNVICTSNGLLINSMDTTHCALVVLKCDRKEFPKYVCEINNALGINLPSLSKVLKVVTPNMSMEFKTNIKSDSLNINLSDVCMFILY